MMAEGFFPSTLAMTTRLMASIRGRLRLVVLMDWLFFKSLPRIGVFQKVGFELAGEIARPGGATGGLGRGSGHALAAPARTASPRHLPKRVGGGAFEVIE